MHQSLKFIPDTSKINFKFEQSNRYLHLGRVYLRFKLFSKQPFECGFEFFPFRLHFMLHCNRRKGMTCLHNNLVQSFSSSSTILLLILQVSKSSLSLSLSLSTHTHLNSKTHTKRLKLFTQYLQHNFSKFGQNHLLLDSSIDQYLPLRD